jgi:NAD-dependent DNA ligase
MINRLSIVKDEYLNDIDDQEVEEEFNPEACPRCKSTATQQINSQAYRCLEEGCGCVFTVDLRDFESRY